MSRPTSKMFFTSDWHLYDRGVLIFDQRPFKTLEEMHEGLIRRFNSTVTPKDVTYFLGDLGSGTVEEMAAIISRLNGIKHMVIGNHDKQGFSRYIEMGFSSVTYGMQLYVGDYRVTASHCPLKDVYREDTRQMRGATENSPWHGNHRAQHRRCSFRDEGQYHLHGHIHSRKDKDKSKRILGRQIDIGVTANGYAPVSMSQIESWIDKTEKAKKASKPV